MSSIEASLVIRLIKGVSDEDGVEFLKSLTKDIKEKGCRWVISDENAVIKAEIIVVMGYDGALGVFRRKARVGEGDRYIILPEVPGDS